MKIGDKIRILKDIWDDGQDHHPPCYLAKKDEVLIIRGFGVASIGVSHENVNGKFFWVYMGEYELL